MAQGESLTVCTFNVWGLYVSPNRRARMLAIAERLSKTRFDIIALQELWVQKDYQLLRDKLQAVYPYAHRFHSGVLGSGLAIFSKYEITNLDFHSFRLNGNPLHVTHGDWYVGKGVGHARIKHPKQHIDFFVSHMIANYHSKKGGQDIYRVHRCVQMVEFCNFIRQTSEEGHLRIAVGDLNVEPADLLYQEVFDKGMFLAEKQFALRSVWRDCNEEDSATFNRHTNSYHRRDKAAECIDYVLYDPSMAKCEGVELFLTEQIDASGPSYSDHCAVVATFALEQGADVDSAGKSSLGPYYHQGAQDYMQMLKGRQDLLQVVATVALGMFVLLLASTLRDEPGSKQVMHTVKYFLLIPAFVLLSALVGIYCNLWLRYEINVLTEIVAEWSLWLKQTIY